MDDQPTLHDEDDLEFANGALQQKKVRAWSVIAFIGLALLIATVIFFFLTR